MYDFPIYIHKCLNYVTFEKINSKDEIVGWYRSNGEKYNYVANIEIYKLPSFNNGRMVIIVSPHKPINVEDLIEIKL